MKFSGFEQFVALICLMSMSVSQTCLANDTNDRFSARLVKMRQEVGNRNATVFEKGDLRFVLIVNDDPEIENTLVLPPDQTAGRKVVAGLIAVAGIVGLMALGNKVIRGRRRHSELNELKIRRAEQVNKNSIRRGHVDEALSNHSMDYPGEEFADARAEDEALRIKAEGEIKWHKFQLAEYDAQIGAMMEEGKTAEEIQEVQETLATCRRGFHAKINSDLGILHELRNNEQLRTAVMVRRKTTEASLKNEQTALEQERAELAKPLPFFYEKPAFSFNGIQKAVLAALTVGGVIKLFKDIYDDRVKARNQVKKLISESTDDTIFLTMSPNDYQQMAKEFSAQDFTLAHEFQAN